MTAVLEQALVVLQNPRASAEMLKAAADQARSAVREIDAESEKSPAREAEILAGMTRSSIGATISALGRHDDECVSRSWARKIATHLAAALDARVREIDAREAAKPPEQVRREQEQARREAHLQAQFDRVPVLFRTDFMISKLGKSAWHSTPRPQGSHVSYIREFTVQRVLGQSVTETTKVPGWPPKYGEFARIEWPNSDVDEDEAITAPLRRLCQKSSVSEDEASLAIERAQTEILREFGQTCAEIRRHFPDCLPRFMSLPALTTPRAMAAE